MIAPHRNTLKYTIQCCWKKAGPKKGMSASQGIDLACDGMAKPTKRWPMKADSPVPKIDSARPVATWLVASTSASHENSVAISMPASAPAAKPISGDWVW